MDLRLELTARILDIPDVEERKSKFSSEPAIFWGKREIAHFHSNSEIDIRLTKSGIRELNLNSKNRTSDWHEFQLSKSSDLTEVVKLIEHAVRFNKLK